MVHSLGALVLGLHGSLDSSGLFDLHGLHGFHILGLGFGLGHCVLLLGFLNGHLLDVLGHVLGLHMALGLQDGGDPWSVALGASGQFVKPVEPNPTGALGGLALQHQIMANTWHWVHLESIGVILGIGGLLGLHGLGSFHGLHCLHGLHGFHLFLALHGSSGHGHLGHGWHGWYRSPGSLAECWNAWANGC